MYKVLALDLDGTVLTDDHRIHPEVKKAIQEAQQKCHVVIVTGRHHTAARPYYDELGLTTPIICCNGTYVYDYHNDRVLKHNSIAKEDALTFIALAKEFQVKERVSGQDGDVRNRCHDVLKLQPNSLHGSVGKVGENRA